MQKVEILFPDELVPHKYKDYDSEANPKLVKRK